MLREVFRLVRCAGVNICNWVPGRTERSCSIELSRYYRSRLSGFLLSGFLPVRWFLSLRLPPRRPLAPRTSVVIRELLDVDNGMLADREVLSAWGRASRKPVGLRNRFEAAGASSFNASSFLHLDIKVEVNRKSVRTW